MRATFQMLKAKSMDDWFGIYFRSAATPLMGSHLVYVRKNGMIEVAVYPGPKILDTFSLGRPISGRKTLTIEFENEHLEIGIGRVHFQSNRLSHQIVGRVLFAAWQSDVDVDHAEMICRDTIE